jgi:predicted thioesterase
MLETGLTYTSRLTVGNENTAIALGSGDMPVLATPAMMALMENAAMLAVASELEDGDTTVGGHIESSHLRPTPVGAEVSATATLEKVEGRKLYFKIIAHQGDVVIGEGTHLRFIVNREKFLAKIL